MTTVPCPRCGRPTIQTPADMLLDPQPCETGLWLTNGVRVTARDIIHGRAQHAAHNCQPPETDQLDLFG